MGVGQAASMACEQAKGKYIARIDADDICMPDRFMKQVGYLENHKKTVLLSSAAEFIDEEGKTVGRSFPYTNGRVLCNLLKSGNMCITHPACMFRTDAYRKSGGYKGVIYSEDLLMCGRLSKYGDVYNFKETLIKYRTVQNSVSKLSHIGEYEKAWLCLLSKIISDNIVNTDDIQVFNSIIMLNRRANTKQNNNILQLVNKLNTKSTINRVYDILSLMVGNALAEGIIILLKNVYGRIKY